MANVRQHAETQVRPVDRLPEERAALSPTVGRTMLSQLHLIRAFEEKVLDLAGQGLVHGPAHSAIGQEGGAVGSAMAMRGSDQINGSHRAHHQFLAKALAYAAPGGIDPEANFGETLRTLSKRTLSEILGLAEGFCKGRGGSMHLRWAESGNLGTNAIVGGGVPMAAGAAWAHKNAGTGDVVYTYFGDGAANQGQVYETYNMAELWKLPVIFVIENNGYAMGTSMKRSTKSTTFFGRGAAYGIEGEQVDGMDVLAVKAAGEKAVAHCRAGKGPYILEMMTYRYRGHSMSDPAKYRTREEVEKIKQEKDCIEHVRDLLTQGGLASEDELKTIDKDIKEIVNASAEFAKESPEPALTELWTDIYA